eukprot:3830-Heterococcus_DN1.PRE.1
MTKRKSGLPKDDYSCTGITSLCNLKSGTQKRAAALLKDEALKRAQHYETVTLTDLAAWPAVVSYDTLSKRLQGHVLEYYTWIKLRQSPAMHHTVAESCNKLQDPERTTLAKQLCDIHTIIDFTLRTQVLPEYIKCHTTGGEQTLHWESIPPGSSTQLQRKLTLERMQ